MDWKALGLGLIFILIVACEHGLEEEHKVEEDEFDMETIPSKIKISDTAKYEILSARTKKDGGYPINWPTFGLNIDLKETYSEADSAYFWDPDFSDSLKALNGEQIIIAGYILEIDTDYFVLSAKLMSECYFCGGGGPESILRLIFPNNQPPKKFEMDEFLTFKGKLKLNLDDKTELFLILKNAKIYRR